MLTAGGVLPAIGWMGEKATGTITVTPVDGLDAALGWAGSAGSGRPETGEGGGGRGMEDAVAAGGRGCGVGGLGVSGAVAGGPGGGEGRGSGSAWAGPGLEGVGAVGVDGGVARWRRMPGWDDDSGSCWAISAAIWEALAASSGSREEGWRVASRQAEASRAPASKSERRSQSVEVGSWGAGHSSDWAAWRSWSYSGASSGCFRSRSVSWSRAWVVSPAR